MLPLRPSPAFKEFAEDSCCKQSIRVAERVILKNSKNIIWYHPPQKVVPSTRSCMAIVLIGLVKRVNKDKHTVSEMQKLLKVNCLRKGDFQSCKGKRWMVPVDGSLSSYLALEETIKLVDPAKDHIFVITGTQDPPSISCISLISFRGSERKNPGVQEGKDNGSRRAAHLCAVEGRS
jgi:hypothetical protein